jgi:hypothetical protein
MVDWDAIGLKRTTSLPGGYFFVLNIQQSKNIFRILRTAERP